MTLSKIEEMMVPAHKLERGLTPKVTDKGAMERRRGESFPHWAKRINDEINEEKSAAPVRSCRSQPVFPSQCASKFSMT